MAVVISDDFNRANSTDLGADWTELEQSILGTGLEIVDQTLFIGSDAPGGGAGETHRATAIYNTPLDSPDMVITFKVQTLTGPSSLKHLWLHVRYPSIPTATTSLPSYAVRLSGWVEHITLRRIDDSGSAATIGTWSVKADLPDAWQDYEVHVWNTPDAVVFQLWIDGVDHGQVADASPLRLVTGNYTGVQLLANRNFPVQIDDFQARVRGEYELAAAANCEAELAHVQYTIEDDFNRANSSNLGSLWDTTVSWGTFGILSNQLEASGDTQAYAICKVEPYPGDVLAGADVVYGLAAPLSECRFELRFRMPSSTYDSGPFYALIFEKTGGGDKASAGLSLWRFLADGDIDNATELWYDNTYYLTNVNRTLQVKVFDQSDRVRIEIWVDGTYFTVYEDTSSTRIEATAGNYVGLMLKSYNPPPGNPNNDLRVDNFNIAASGHVYTEATVTAHTFCEPFLAAVDLNVGPIHADVVCAPVALVDGVNYWAHGPRIQASLWGKARITNTISGKLSGRARLLDPEWERILIWYAPNQWPDTTEAPDYIIDSAVGTEYTTPQKPLPPTPKPWYYVLRRENAIGLRSAFQRIGPLMVGGDGYIGPRPSPLSLIGLVQDGDDIYVLAEYRPLVDGAHAATHAVFWYTYAQGSEPDDPDADDTVLVLTLQNVDGITSIRSPLTVGSVAEGLQIKVRGYTRYASSLVQDAWVESELSAIANITAIAPAIVDLDQLDLSVAAVFGQGVPS